VVVEEEITILLPLAEMEALVVVVGISHRWLERVALEILQVLLPLKEIMAAQILQTSLALR
jgi:hypothetical protein